jgi:hypothetical protein
MKRLLVFLVSAIVFSAVLVSARTTLSLSLAKK